MICIVDGICIYFLVRLNWSIVIFTYYTAGGVDYTTSQLLPQDRAPSREKGQPLCMAQYQRLFASYRMPGLEQDQLKSFPPPDENEHIIVAYQGQV